MKTPEQIRKESKKTGRRTSIVYGFIFLTMTGLLLRLGYLQVNRGKQFRSQASDQQISYVPVLPARGWIYDDNHQLLAYDIPSTGIVLTRLHNGRIQNIYQLANILAPVLKESISSLVNQMNNEDKWQDQIYLLQNANNYQVSFVAEHKSELPGINLVVSSERDYPYGDLAGQVLGYVGAMTPSEAKVYTQQPYNYSLNQIIGQDGIEKQYESYLQGKPGQSAIVINNLGIPMETLGLNPPPVQGNTLNLTIDGHLQSIAQQDMATEVAQLTSQGKDVKNAAAVMLNVKTGGVISMVSYPYYNPNWFVNPKQLAEHAQTLNTFNYATQGIYMPGSTVKPANMLLGLLKGAITPHTIIDDPGYLMIGTYQMHGDDINGAGLVNPIEALQISDDIFMYQLSLWLAHWPPTNMSINTWLKTERTQTLKEIAAFEQRFGLGVKTGIDLPSESTGYFTDGGILYDLPATAIGQRQAFTPLQLATYTETIANNGKRLEPHLLQSVATPNGKIIKTITPTVETQISAPQSYWNILHQGMYEVCNTPQGTAAGSFLNAPYKAAGKTGTAQTGIGQNDNSVFIAYAPYNHPQVAVAVVIPNGGYGALGAVPVARELLDAYFKEHHEFFPKSQWTSNQISSSS